MYLPRKITAAAFGVALAVSITAPAAADHENISETTAQRCDTWYRDGHGAGSGAHHTSTLDTAAGPLYFHNHSGHYVLRGDGFYVEVVGGSYYSTPGGSASNQGGFVQGEIDPGAPVPADADFHANFFADGKAGACAAPANTKVGDQGKDPYH